MQSNFVSTPVLVCFEDEDEATKAAAAEVARKAAEEAAKAPRFTQDDVNKLLAEEKRKAQVALKKTEENIQKQLESAKLTEEQRVKAQADLEEVQGLLRTKEEQAKIEKQKLETDFTKRVKDAESRAEKAEKMYKEEKINRALEDAADKGDAFRPTQVVKELLGHTMLTTEGRVIVNFPDVEVDTGNPIVKVLTPAEAVKRMAEMPEHENLFKSKIAGGLGGNGSSTMPVGTNGKVDLHKIDGKRYLELRKTPEGRRALGLEE